MSGGLSIEICYVMILFNFRSETMCTQEACNSEKRAHDSLLTTEQACTVKLVFQHHLKF